MNYKGRNTNLSTQGEMRSPIDLLALSLPKEDFWVDLVSYGLVFLPD